MDGRIRSFPPGGLAAPTITAYLNSAVSPNIVMFEADIASTGNEQGPFQYEWEFAVSGSGITATYGGKIVSGHTANYSLASGTVVARVRLRNAFGIVRDFVYSALVTFSTPSAGGVTSVAMTGDNVIYNSAVTGSPIATSGTLVPVLKTWAANTALLGPTSGGAATPTVRTLTSADLISVGNQLLFSNTTVPAGNTVANTTTPTAFTSSFTIPANSVVLGQVFHIRLAGVYGVATLSTPTITLQFLIGSTVLCTSGAVTTVGGLTNDGWTAWCDFIVTATGSSGTAEAQGFVEYETASTTNLASNMQNTAAITGINWTTTNVLTAQITWGTASASNTIQDRQFIVTTDEAASANSLGGATITVTAFENLAIRACVYIEDNGSVNTAGNATNADSSNVLKSTQSWVAGFATAAISAGATGPIQVAGALGGFSGLTAGAVYYVGSAGAITSSAPANAVMVGIALNTTTLLVNTRGAQSAINPFVTTITGVKGYVAGGTVSGSDVKTADKLTFSTSTTTATSTANLSDARRAPGVISDNSAKVYFCGGTHTGVGQTNITDATTVSTDTNAAITSANVPISAQAAGMSQRSTVGYLGGVDVSNVGSTTIYKLTFGTAVFSTDGAVLSQARFLLAAMTNGSSAGYWIGGTTGSLVTTTDKFAFVADTITTPGSAALGTATDQMSWMSNGSTIGFVIGGSTGSNTAQAYQLTFSTDTMVAANTANLGAAALATGMSSGSSTGWSFSVSATTASQTTYNTAVTATVGSAALTYTSTNLTGAGADCAL